MAWEDRGRILFASVSMCVLSEKNPNWSSMADNANTWSGIGVPGSPVYSCEWHADLLSQEMIYRLAEDVYL